MISYLQIDIFQGIIRISIITINFVFGQSTTTFQIAQGIPSFSQFDVAILWEFTIRKHDNFRLLKQKKNCNL